MTPKLKGISTLEISSPLEEYCPEDIYNLSLYLDLVIGSKELERGDFSSITVTTFQYLHIDIDDVKINRIGFSINYLMKVIDNNIDNKSIRDELSKISDCLLLDEQK